MSQKMNRSQSKSVYPSVHEMSIRVILFSSYNLVHRWALNEVRMLLKTARIDPLFRPLRIQRPVLKNCYKKQISKFQNFPPKVPHISIF